MSSTFPYDVFLTFSTKDEAAMRELGRRLTRDGLRVWLEAGEAKAAQTAQSTTASALEQSRTMVLGMSKNAIGPDWATLEHDTTLFRDPSSPERRFVPVLLDDTEIHESLKQFAYIDWRQQLPAQYAQLLAFCRPDTAGSWRRKPDHISPQRILKGHDGVVSAIATTADASLIVSGGADGTLKVWKSTSGESVTTLAGFGKRVCAVAISPDGRFVGGVDGESVRVWDLSSGDCIALVLSEGFRSLTLTAPQKLAANSWYHGKVQIWDISRGGSPIAFAEEEIGDLLGIHVVGNDVWIVSYRPALNAASVWRLFPSELLLLLKGHAKAVTSVAFPADVSFAVSGSLDNTVRVWSFSSGNCVAILEGHSDAVNVVATAKDGSRVVSGSDDKTVRIWDPESGECLFVLGGHTAGITGVSISADGSQVLSSSRDGTLRIWELPTGTIAGEGSAASPDPNATKYTNAKVLLAGDSGVGKTGLAIRLTQDRFEPTISTDAAWTTQLPLPHETSSPVIEREIWLWDFAGQADYRLIHQLYMDETALAVLVFNPQSENPFEGLGQWDLDLQRAARRPFQKLLVAARVDRGGLMLSSESVERFREQYGFVEYIETSALDGTGCDHLRNAIVAHIPWNEIPWTASPRIFRLLKEEIVKLRDAGKVLLRIVELKQQLEMRLPGEHFTIDDLRAVVGLLAGAGVVWQLEFGDFVVLRSEWINIYAAALIRSVRAHIGEIGVILEQDVLSGNLKYTVDRQIVDRQIEDSVSPPMPSSPRAKDRYAEQIRRLPHEEEAVVLRAMHQTFVDHGLCLREHTEIGAQLVFPSYFRRELPKDPGHPPILVSYQFAGNANDIYATLVVKLHHTKAFESGDLWRYAADFKTHDNKRMGLIMKKESGGAAEISVYFEPRISDDTQVTFIKYVHEHLLAKAQDVKRLRHYFCQDCSTPVQDRSTALSRLESGLKDIVCGKCEQRIPLWDLVEQKFASEEFQHRVRELEELAAASINNESKDLILRGHAFVVAGEAGQIYREYTGSDHGIDGEIEFKDLDGKASGKRLYLQLKSGDSYLYKRKKDGAEVFTIKKERWADYWQQHAYPVMLVIRTSDGQIRWMNVTEYLARPETSRNKVVFEGEPFTALNLSRMRDRFMGRKP